MVLLLLSKSSFNDKAVMEFYGSLSWHRIRTFTFVHPIVPHLLGVDSKDCLNISLFFHPLKVEAQKRIHQMYWLNLMMTLENISKHLIVSHCLGIETKRSLNTSPFSLQLFPSNQWRTYTCIWVWANVPWSC